MRCVALDVHQTFCEVAIWEAGEVRLAGQVKSQRAALELFAQSLDPSDRVAMESTGPAMEIARILEPHVAQVIVANAQELRAISHARVKTDRYDARTLAQLLHAGMLESVWVPDATTQALRRAWLARQELPAEEAETVTGCLQDRLPRRGGRGDRRQARRVGHVLSRGTAADDDPRRRARRRGGADGGDRRHLALFLPAQAGRLPGPRRQGAPVRR